MKRAAALLALLALLLARARPAPAQEAGGDGLTISRSHVGLAGAGLLAAFLLARVPARGAATWRRHLLPVDCRLEDDFSPRLARVSDILLATAIAAPALAELGSGEEGRERILVYGEAQAANLLLVAVVKLAVRRPRPYLYHPDAAVRAWGREQHDARVSFYSGHASSSFTAAAAGGLLANLATPDRRVRALAWGGGFALAGATATLRTRAGKHFYSDVVIGSLIGIGIGAAVPLLHSESGRRPQPSGIDLLSAAGGLGVGILAARLLPAGEGRAPRTTTVVPTGTGLALLGLF